MTRDEEGRALCRQLIAIAIRARDELGRNPAHAPARLPERPRDEYGERIKVGGQIAPKWVQDLLREFLDARLKLERVASPGVKWEGVRLHMSLMNLLATPSDWEFRQDQGRAAHDESIASTQIDFEQALARMIAVCESDADPEQGPA